MEKPLVTIVTITYNLIKSGREKTFLQTVESVKNQTYDNIEYLIIDGASNDGTVDLVQSLGLKYYSEKDNGIYDALNKGIEKATGKYICFMHSDDFFNNKDAVKLSVEALEKKQADFSFATASFIEDDEEGKFLFYYKPKIWNVYSRMPFCHQTMFTKVDTLRKLGGFDLKYKSAGDYDLIIKLMLNGYKYVKVNANIATFRTGGFSFKDMRTSLTEQYEIFKTQYSPYLTLPDQEYEKILIFDYLPLRLLKAMKINDFSVLWYNLKNKFYYMRRNFLKAKLPGKTPGYLKLFGYWIVPDKTRKYEVMSLEEYIEKACENAAK